MSKILKNYSQLPKRLIPFFVTLVLVVGCQGEYRTDLDYTHRIQQTWEIKEIEDAFLTQFEQVVFEPDDTISLREQISESLIVEGKDVLELATGTGLLSVLSLRCDAKLVVATDTNPVAVANARYNAAVLAPDRKIDVRQVPAESEGAFGGIKEMERFDLIICNTPWINGGSTQTLTSGSLEKHFSWMDSLAAGLPDHLNPSGRCLITSRYRPAIEYLRSHCQEMGFSFQVLDDRTIDDLDEAFLPGLLMEIKVPTALLNGSASGATLSE